MDEIHERIFIGQDFECFTNKEGWAVVHACKTPCHQGAVGYKGNLHKSHPNYLIMKEGRNLYLNIIDPNTPLFMLPLFTMSLEFINDHWTNGNNILIHCNRGQSRAPTIAMLFLAKGIGVINNNSFEKAKIDFIKIFPRYNPGRGIQIFISKNWTSINNIWVQ